MQIPKKISEIIKNPDLSFENEEFYTNKKNFFKTRQDIAEGKI